jgi:hypothetical protein
MSSTKKESVMFKQGNLLEVVLSVLVPYARESTQVQHSEGPA